MMQNQKNQPVSYNVKSAQDSLYRLKLNYSVTKKQIEQLMNEGNKEKAKELFDELCTLNIKVQAAEQQLKRARKMQQERAKSCQTETTLKTQVKSQSSNWYMNSYSTFDDVAIAIEGFLCIVAVAIIVVGIFFFVRTVKNNEPGYAFLIFIGVPLSEHILIKFFLWLDNLFNKIEKKWNL